MFPFIACFLYFWLSRVFFHYSILRVRFYNKIKKYVKTYFHHSYIWRNWKTGFWRSNNWASQKIVNPFGTVWMTSCSTIADTKSLDFTVISFLMKLFKSANMDLANDCLLHSLIFITQWTDSREKGEICEQICYFSQSASVIWNWLYLVKSVFLCICCITICYHEYGE